MISKKSLAALALFVMALGPSHWEAFAETIPDQTSPAIKLKPIEIDFTTLGGLSYSNENGLLESYKDFEELIYPLRDYEATRLLKRSESSDLNAKIFSGIGLVGVLTGLVGLLVDSSNDKTGFWVTTVGGGIVFDIGGLFKSEAQTTKFNCVQRYNRFARGESQVLPQPPTDEKALLNFDGEKGASANKINTNEKTKK